MTNIPTCELCGKQEVITERQLLGKFDGKEYVGTFRLCTECLMSMQENDNENNQDEQPDRPGSISDIMEELQSQIGPAAGPPRGASPTNVDDLPDDPGALKQRLQAEQEKLQNTSAIYQQMLKQHEMAFNRQIGELENKIDGRFDSFEENLSTSEHPEIWDTLSEHGGNILLGLSIILASFFLLLGTVDATTAGGVALVIATIIQLILRNM